MNAGEIGTEAGRIFEYNLPSNWIFRSQEDQNDFGIDGEIELKSKNGKALGKDSVFKVQIKGEESSIYINEGKTLSFKLKVARLKYYFEFKVPVIIVVVEVSSEKIYWLPITNDESLRRKVFESGDNASIQIHLPVANSLARKDDELAQKILNTVIDCWEYLNIKGLKESVSRYQSITPSLLKKNIDDIGEVLYKAYHQQLNNLLLARDFTGVFQQASKICVSPIVPAEDRFTALLYYWQAFQIAPFTNIEREKYDENFKICHWLVNLAREQKSRTHRLIAIGKTRVVKFKFQLEELHVTHSSIGHFKKDSLEYYIFNSSTNDLYRESSVSLIKIIDLCNRLTKNRQYHILASLFIDIYVPILQFKLVHEARGTSESIEFLDQWQEETSLLVMQYYIIINDVFRIENLYFLISTSLEKDTKATCEARKLILYNFPDFEEKLNDIEKSVKEFDDNRDFYSLSIHEQKTYFIDIAKSLRMDPDDSESEYGRIVSKGLKNYDPTNIMKNCESLFVYYRPSGIIASSLGMHSAGGVHLLACLKHGHTQGTGGLLATLYDNPNVPDFMFGFKQNYCDTCLNCTPRTEDWSWNLNWYKNAVEENRDFLDKHDF